MTSTATSIDQAARKHLFPSLLILPVTFAAFYFLPQLLDKTAGYLTAFAIYWVFCLLHGLRLKSGAMAKLYTWPEMGKQNLLLVLLCFMPVMGAFSAAFLVAYPYLDLSIYFILAAAALVNGFIEEFYWRGAFISRYKQNFFFAFLVPTALFGFWHISVYAAYGIAYQGGFWPLVGGAFFMGIIWGYTAFKQQRVLVPTIAHILANFFAFSNLIAENWLR
ncbi:CPBP family intramembrane glutamic endopeptidase [Pontibacter locisalis]|uniref:CPBP family intramembrane glutamic endopeptidase n=1 Tax=Pontibacter locisalis TaxID=1719035 RepID=A0ABW5IPE8_9BACT